MNPRLSVRNLLIAGTIATSLGLAGCTYMEDMPGPENGDGPKMCTKEYMPVCGAKGYKRKTFGNACEANNAGYSVIKEGKCTD